MHSLYLISLAEIGGRMELKVDVQNFFGLLYIPYLSQIYLFFHIPHNLYPHIYNSPEYPNRELAQELLARGGRTL